MPRLQLEPSRHHRQRGARKQVIGVPGLQASLRGHTRVRRKHAARVGLVAVSSAEKCGRVLDLCRGAGTLARELASSGFRGTGLDPWHERLAVRRPCQSQTRDHCEHGRAPWRERGMQSNWKAPVLTYGSGPGPLTRSCAGLACSAAVGRRRTVAAANRDLAASRLLLGKRHRDF